MSCKAGSDGSAGGQSLPPKEGTDDTGAPGRGLLRCTQRREGPYHRSLGTTLPLSSWGGVWVCCVGGWSRGWGGGQPWTGRVGGGEGEWGAPRPSLSWQMPTAAPSCPELSLGLFEKQNQNCLKRAFCDPVEFGVKLKAALVAVMGRIVSPQQLRMLRY